MAGYFLVWHFIISMLCSTPNGFTRSAHCWAFWSYDLVLFLPLFARFGNLQPEHVRGQVAASLIIIFSAALGVYYLFVNPATRLRARTEM